MGVVYKITSPSGKAYIGKTVGSLDHRLQIHYGPGSKCPAIRRAIAKYGVANMKTEILKVAPDAELSRLEVEMIAEHNTFGPMGYNLTSGGETPPLKYSNVVDKLKATLSKPSVKKKLSDAQKRNHARPGAKEKRSKALKEAHSRPETKAKFKAAWKKAQSTDEAKQKQRVAQKLAWSDPEKRAKRMAGIAKWNKEKGPEVIKKKSEGLKRAWALKREKAHLKSGTTANTTQETHP